MEKDSFYLESKCDGLRIYVTTFIPKGNIKGIIQFAHGMVEHQVYYYDIMEYFCDKGYLCIINDHRGHGLSTRKMDDLGYFYDEKGDYIVEDLHQITEYIKDRYNNLDVYLFGHSMGSLVVRKYIKKYDKDIKKVIICGSPSNRKISSLGLVLCKIIKLFKGKRYRSKIINNMVLTNKSIENWLTKDKKYLKDYSEDIYCNYIFTINGFINLIYLLKDVYSKKGWNINNKDLELFFIAGSDDVVVKNKQSFLESINYLKNIGYNNVTYKIYDNCYHSVFKDNPTEVYKDILEFIENS